MGSGASAAEKEAVRAEYLKLCKQHIEVMSQVQKEATEADADSFSAVVKRTREQMKTVMGKLDKIWRKCQPAEQAGTSKFSVGIAEVDVDRGRTEFFEGASSTRGVVPTVSEALGKAEGWVVCKACNAGIEEKNKEIHCTTRCKKNPDQKYTVETMFTTMTAEWAVQQADKVLTEREAGKVLKDWERKWEPFKLVAMYTLHSPLCYTVGAAMRDYAFKGGDKFLSAFLPKKNFAYSLHRALMTLPKYAGTVFRAMNFRVSDALYTPGSVVTMPHATSASTEPGVVKDFLGQAGSKGVTGTILILRVRRAREVWKFSVYPDEREVLIPTNTQFRVVSAPDVGVRKLLESALDTDLSNVAVVELQEISFVSWGDLRNILTPIERFRNEPLLKTIQGLKVEEERPTFHRDPVTGEYVEVHFPLATALPCVEGKEDEGKRKTLLQLALQQGDESVVLLCIANLSIADHTDAFNEALAGAVRAKALGDAHHPSNDLNDDDHSSRDKIIAVLLSKGARAGSLPEKLLTTDLALVGCLCKLDVIDKVITALGSAFWKKGSGGMTVLHAAAANNRDDLLTKLLEADEVSINECDDEGRTPTFVAARYGHAKALDVLIKHGANVNQATTKDETPCYAAAARGHSDALRKLIESKADVNSADSEGRTPSYAAAMRGNKDVLNILIKEGGASPNIPTENGSTPCYIAALNGHTAALETLIQLGADVNQATNRGATPCLVAAAEGHTDALRLLIKNGANIDAATYSGLTPSYEAARDGHSEALRVLIEAGADIYKPRTKDPSHTPCLAARENGHTDAVCILEEQARADAEKRVHPPPPAAPASPKLAVPAAGTIEATSDA
eukprot:Hpha_TRINITY_DN16977_c0_g1::TRINITY_DN16977_c0_g1_i17::g.56229::m.56229